LFLTLSCSTPASSSITCATTGSVDGRYRFDSPDARLFTSIVCEGELRSLALRLGCGSEKTRRMEEQLARAITIPLEYEGVVQAYARIDAHCRRMGTPLGENDTWIAAAANATGARLLTTDTDFDHLDPAFLRRDWIDPRAHRSQRAWSGRFFARG
jgi:predicted nucleic acid-binding protein